MWLGRAARPAQVFLDPHVDPDRQPIGEPTADLLEADVDTRHPRPGEQVALHPVLDLQQLLRRRHRRDSPFAVRGPWWRCRKEPVRGDLIHATPQRAEEGPEAWVHHEDVIASLKSMTWRGHDAIAAGARRAADEAGFGIRRE